MKRWIAVIAVGVLALAMAAPATGKVKVFSSTVKVTGFNLGSFDGQVRSTFDKCKKKRSVELWDDNTSPTPDSLVDTDKTDGKGAWSITDLFDTKVYAVARNKTGSYKTKSGARKHYQCPEVTSPVFTR